MGRLAEEARKRCANCNTLLPFHALYCSYCGIEQLDHKRPPDANKDPLVGTVLDNRFEILECIGKGGMATVYRARQLSEDRTVALKLLNRRFLQDPSLKRRFHREAKLASLLNHPNTVKTYDYGELPSGMLYIAMEYIEGSVLTQELKKRYAMTWRRASRIVIDVARSVHDAHLSNIIHRDIKPDNIMVAWYGAQEVTQVVKVLDFGIAKLIDHLTVGGQSTTSSNEVFGTPEYMSPEQISSRPLDHRTDIYSLGVILYRMLTGRLPFAAPTPLLMMMCHIHQPPPRFARVNRSLHKLPQGLEELVMAMLAKKPEARPASMAVVWDRLNTILTDRSRGFFDWTPTCGIPLPQTDQVNHELSSQEDCSTASQTIRTDPPTHPTCDGPIDRLDDNRQSPRQRTSVLGRIGTKTKLVGPTELVQEEDNSPEF